MGLKQFERRLERLVEGAFTKAFRSGLQPVEIGRRLVREIDDRRTVGVRGVIAPNRFTIWVSPDDRERMEGFEAVMVRELADYAREHARNERYRFVGHLHIEVETDEGMQRGDLVVDAEVDDEGLGLAGSVLLPDGERVALGDDTTVIGRHAECQIALDDRKVSRRHAEIRPDGDEFRLVDLGSTNGTEVNGSAVTEHVLADGDTIKVGDTALRFEAS